MSAAIPTLPDLAERINQRIADSVVAGDMEEEVANAVAEVFSSGGNGDVFALLAFARSCHSAAEVRRSQGDHNQAGLLFAMAQDMLATAVETLAEITAADVQISGVTRH